jgi:cytochrome P450
VDLFSTSHPVTTGVDISSKAFWDQSFNDRDKSFALLRATAPVSWHPSTEVVQDHNEQGFWAVTKAQDITAVERDTDVFQSKYGVAMVPTPVDQATAGVFFLTMDPPEHSRYRGLVSAAFTPRAIRQISDRIEANAATIVDDLIGAGDIDFVQACASRLPMTTVSDIVGVPEADRKRVAEAAENLVGDPAAAGVSPDKWLDFVAGEFLYLYSMGASLAAHRRENPGDDLMTNLVQAEIDGERLTDDHIGQFMVLMAVAGNDTTKQTTTSAMLALQRHPEQRDWLMADFDGRVMGAIEELVRYASPVIQFSRTAVRDVELNGAQIAAGDKVVLFFCSGNRDEAICAAPEEFILSRPRVPHVGFGGGGPHFCLGHGVARTQLKAILGQLLTRVPGIELGEPVPMRSNFINGIAALPAHV